MYFTNMDEHSRVVNVQGYSCVKMFRVDEYTLEPVRTKYLDVIIKPANVQDVILAGFEDRVGRLDGVEEKAEQYIRSEEQINCIYKMCKKLFDNKQGVYLRKLATKYIDGINIYTPGDDIFNTVVTSSKTIPKVNPIYFFERNKQLLCAFYLGESDNNFHPTNFAASGVAPKYKYNCIFVATLYDLFKQKSWVDKTITIGIGETDVTGSIVVYGVEFQYQINIDIGASIGFHWQGDIKISRIIVISKRQIGDKIEVVIRIYFIARRREIVYFDYESELPIGAIAIDEYHIEIFVEYNAFCGEFEIVRIDDFLSVSLDDDLYDGVQLPGNMALPMMLSGYTTLYVDDYRPNPLKGISGSFFKTYNQSVSRMDEYNNAHSFQRIKNPIEINFTLVNVGDHVVMNTIGSAAGLVVRTEYETSESGLGRYYSYFPGVSFHYGSSLSSITEDVVSVNISGAGYERTAEIVGDDGTGHGEYVVTIITEQYSSVITTSYQNYWSFDDPVWFGIFPKMAISCVMFKDDDNNEYHTRLYHGGQIITEIVESDEQYSLERVEWGSYQDIVGGYTDPWRGNVSGESYFGSATIHSKRNVLVGDVLPVAPYGTQSSRLGCIHYPKSSGDDGVCYFRHYANNKHEILINNFASIKLIYLLDGGNSYVVLKE